MPVNLARVIGEPERTVQLRQAVVSAVAADGTCSVKLGNSVTAIGGVRRLASSETAVGAVVWVLQQGYDLLVLGPVAATGWGTSMHQEGLELYHPNSTPYIDFHRASSPAGDAGADYNMRLMNEANGYLVLFGGTFKANGALEATDAVFASNWFRSYGATGWYSQTWGGGWHMTDADWVRAYNGKGVYTTGEIRANTASMRDHAVHANHAVFGHWTRVNQSEGYGFLQRHDDWTYISSVRLTIINSSAESCIFDNDALHMTQRIAMRDHSIYTRAYNDDWHVHGWWSGNDGLRITEYGGLYFRVRDQDPVFRIEAYATSVFARFDQLGGWDTAALVVRSFGGGSPAMVSWHAQGQNAAHLIKNWFSALECRSWDNGGWGIFRGELEDYSSIQSKRNVTRLRDRLGKDDRRRKQQALDMAHFNRRRGGCPNCMGTGLARENRGQNPAMSDPEKREALPVVVGLFGGALDDSPCPDCDGQGMAYMQEHDRKSEEAGWFGFISEEVAVEFPEAVYYRPSEADPSQIEVSGISVQALVAVLWEDNKDQQEEIDALEARLAALEQKGGK